MGTYNRLSWPAAAVHFSHDGALLATASEDSFIDVSEVSTGDQILKIPVEVPTYTVAWHPKRYILAYAGDVEETYRNNNDGMISVFGFSS